MTIVTDLDRGYLTKSCTLLARLFCLLEEDLSTTGGGVDCTLTLIVSSADRLAAMVTDGLIQGLLDEEQHALGQVVHDIVASQFILHLVAFKSHV